MLVRALLSREFLITGGIVAAGIVFWFYQANEQQAKLELLKNPQDQISLTQDKQDEISYDRRHVVAVTDFEFLGKPFTDEDVSYQLLSAKDGKDELDQVPLVIAFSNNLDGEALRGMISSSKGGYWHPVQDSDSEAVSEDPTEDAFVHPDYPELSLSGIDYVGFQDLGKSSLLARMFWVIIGAHILGLLATLFGVVRGFKKRDAWEVKLENFDPKVLEQYSHALRLCGAENPGLPIRRVDPNFDVPQKPKSKRPKLKRWGWKVGAVLAISILGGALQFGTSYGLEDLLQNRYAKIGVAVAFMLGINLAIFKAQGMKVGGTLEEPVKPGSLFARYQQLPFFKYHDHVLKSLGMIELGAFKQTGGHVCMVRTIYLSPNGNVLVEVGVEGKEFFTIESIVNSGKFLETHSMAKPRHVKSDLMKRHLRRSGSHEDILQALEDHDHFVAEFAGSGFNEAQFDAEKFPRFLEWGGEKNAS